MAINRFHRLCLMLCDTLKLPRFTLGDGDGDMGFTIKRQGVSISVLYFPHANERQAVMTFDFAAIPHNDPCAPQIMSALLDTQSPAALSLESIDRTVNLALQWRRERFPRAAAAAQLLPA